jgi:hypothetical protein
MAIEIKINIMSVELSRKSQRSINYLSVKLVFPQTCVRKAGHSNLGNLLEGAMEKNGMEESPLGKEK